MLEDGELDAMTFEQSEQAIEDWRTSRPIVYRDGVVGGSLRILFFPAALVDQTVTGRPSTFWGWSHKYGIPKAENPEQGAEGDG